MILRPAILISAQGLKTTGAGHFMRVLSYAESLVNLGYKVDFYGDLDIPWLIEKLKTLKWIGFATPSNVYSLLIIDSYDTRFSEMILRKFKFEYSLLIADISTPYLEVDMLAWISPVIPSSDSLSGRHLLLHGVDYMMSRKRQVQLEFNSTAQRVAIVLGGLPQIIHIEKVISAMSLSTYQGIEFHIFVESNQIRELPNRPNLILHETGSSIDSIIDLCDTVISGAGTSIWDFLSSRKCVGALKLVENQTENYSYVIDNNLAASLGELLGNNKVNPGALRYLLLDATFRRVILKNSIDLMDGQGSQRFAKKVDEFLKEKPPS